VRRAYDYLFYRFYCYQASQGRNPEEAQWIAFWLLAAFTIVNIMTVVVVADIFVRRLVLPDLSRWVIYPATWVFGLLLYVIHFHGRIHHIIDEFTSESPEQRRFRGGFVVAYALSSFPVFFIAAYVRGVLLKT
jgi:hypothetical protein